MGVWRVRRLLLALHLRHAAKPGSMALHPKGVSMDYRCMRTLVASLAGLVLIVTAHAKVIYVDDNASEGEDGSVGGGGPEAS